MEKMFVFRKYKKGQGKKNVKHPKLIVDSIKNEYGFMGLTTSSKKGRGHNNIILKKNPQKGNTNNSYLRRKIEYDDKTLFEEILHNYELSEEDICFLVQYVEKHKKR